MVSFDDMDRDELLFFIDQYSDYVWNFLNEHEEGMYPVTAYEFFDNEFQDILKERCDYKED